ncbi:multinuclear nonheme iron-dependent oxidase [Pseudomonas soli]|uniref:multinuclear nonheme iron-dependent oxidase n=1 Tax=Pseudomonas soli TaxID=1306993 RepID=UPI00299DDB92|nr:DUF692 family multinuclear iron-containing protein [Pseudomonas soli]
MRGDPSAAPVKERFWAWFADACRRCGAQPTVLERDFNYPPLAELLAETARIRDVQRAHGA